MSQIQILYKNVNKSNDMVDLIKTKKLMEIIWFSGFPTF